MARFHFESEMHSTAERVFAAIVDLRGYHRWLTPSKSFGETTDLSSDPITLGTTFLDSGPGGVRHGVVTEFAPPTRVTFHMPMTMRPRLLGTIDIHVIYALTSTATAVHVRRDGTVTVHGPLKLVRPVVVRQIQNESERTLLALKAFVETQA